MGYTCGDKSITMDSVCYSDGIQSLNTTTAVPAISRFSSSLSPVSHVVPAPVYTSSAHRSISQTPDTSKPHFVMRGGFYKTGNAKRRLFLAGHLCKHANNTART